LLTNAIDACGGRGEIRVASRRCDHQEISVEVSDNGSGIAPEHLSAIFDPFFTTKPEGKGTGLGLPISLRILNQLGGRLSVRSTPGAGTTFTVTLPVEKSDERVSA
jgi:signal transduction histidine kinase